MIPASSSRRKRRSKQAIEPTSDTVTASFVACPRCSFFLSGYRLIHGDFVESVENSDGDWLRLTWDHDTSHLILKTYGSRIDTDTSHYEGTCHDCRRVFIYLGVSDEREKAELHVEIIPG